MTDDDTESAAWFQKELDERKRREDELIERLRKDTSGFRKECDDFTAEFSSKRSILNRSEHADYCTGKGR